MEKRKMVKAPMIELYAEVERGRVYSTSTNERAGLRI